MSEFLPQNPEHGQEKLLSIASSDRGPRQFNLEGTLEDHALGPKKRKNKVGGRSLSQVTLSVKPASYVCRKL